MRPGELKDPRQFISCDFYRIYEKNGEKKIQIIGKYNLTVKTRNGFEMYSSTTYEPMDMTLSEFVRQRNEAQKNQRWNEWHNEICREKPKNISRDFITKEQVIDRANKIFSTGEIKAQRLYQINKDLPEGNYIDRDNFEIRTTKAIFHEKQESQLIMQIRERTIEYMNGDNKTEKQDGLYKTRK